MKLGRLLRHYWVTVVALSALCIIGYLFITVPQEENRWHGLLEAVFIAAFLTVTVDPFVKRRLLKEASQDIFHHLIGIDLPIEMRERLKRYIFDLRYYREQMTLRVEAQREEDGRLRIHVTTDAVVVSLTDCSYQQRLTFEESECARVIGMTARTATRTSEWPAGSEIVESPDEPMELVAQNPDIPLSRGERLNSHFSFNVHGAETDFWVYNFGTTTVDVTVVLRPLPGMEMFAPYSKCRDKNNPNVYHYRRVFIVGDHLHVRWRPKKASSLSAGEAADKAAA
jgi:hypothetical protein